MKVLVGVILICCFLSCSDNKNSSVILKDKYKIVLGNKTDSIYKRRGDSLYIFFETEFYKDLLKVVVDNKSSEYYITTDGSTGYADFINLGELSKFKKIEFSINNGALIKLNDIKTNLIKVNYLKDKIVDIRFSNNPNAYK